MELVLLKNYVVLDEEEMMYLGAGSSLAGPLGTIIGYAAGFA